MADEHSPTKMYDILLFLYLSDLDHLVRHEKSKGSSRDFSNLSSYTENSNTGIVICTLGYRYFIPRLP